MTAPPPTVPRLVTDYIQTLPLQQVRPVCGALQDWAYRNEAHCREMLALGEAIWAIPRLAQHAALRRRLEAQDRALTIGEAAIMLALRRIDPHHGLGSAVADGYAVMRSQLQLCDMTLAAVGFLSLARDASQ